MKHSVMLTIASLLSILFFTSHLTDDIVRGFEKGRVSNLTAVPIFLLALGVTGLFSVILSARGLWSMRRGQS